jgi:hypothetical protein
MERKDWLHAGIGCPEARFLMLTAGPGQAWMTTGMIMGRRR